MQCMFKHDAPVQGIWAMFDKNGNDCETNSSDEEVCISSIKTNGYYLDDIEPIFYWIFVVLFLIQIYNEAQQWRENPCRVYFASVSNIIDVLSIFFNTSSLVLKWVTGVDLNTVRLCASVGLVAMYLQAFYWLRTVDKLAQYVDLITMTMWDIKDFMLVLVLFLMTFYAGLYMIQLNRIEPPYYDGKVAVFNPEGSNGYLFAHGILRMYYLVLGDFGDVNLIRSFENFDTVGQIEILIENLLAVLYFFCATFVTQITILNMMIGIMANTLESHTSNIDEATKRQRLMLQAEFTSQKSSCFYKKLCCCLKNINKRKSDDEDRLMYL